MCDTAAYVRSEGREEILLESIDIIRPDGANVYLKSIFGEERVFEGRLVEVSLSKHRVILARS